MPPQLLGGLDSPPRDPRLDSPLPAHFPVVGRVVAFVGVQFLGPLARPALGPRDGLHRLQHHLQAPHVRDVGRRLLDRQGHSLGVGDQVVLAAGPTAISRVGSGIWAPFLAGTSDECTSARSQSMRSLRPSS